MKKFVLCLCVFVVFGFCSVVLGETEPNDLTGITYTTFGIAEAQGTCPSWFEAFSRDGYDGGQLTIELDGCQIVDYEIFTRAQNAGPGYIANLEPDDLIIVWDEDTDHGSDEQYKNFTFNGTYVAEPDCDYVQLSTTDSSTNWAIYRVTSSGRLDKGSAGMNEHEAIHIEGNLLDFEKTDDIGNGGCAGPGDEFTYTVCWNNTSGDTFENAYIVDYLPQWVDYDWLISIVPYETDPNYSQDEHTYTWQLGDIAPDDSGCVSLTVTVNENAEPGMDMRNMAKLWADPNILVAWHFLDTPVCCWVDDPNIIYVDMSAEGSNSGIDWTNAYSGREGLQRAITRATDSTCEGPFSIYVAAGTYSPGNFSSDSFRLPEGSRVYGGFMPGGSDVSSRNPDLYKTVLTGYELNDTVVTMADDIASDANFPVDENTLLDGFTITDAVEYGIYGTGVDFTIVNCTVTDSGQQGIYAADCNVSLHWCVIDGSGEEGVYHEGEGDTITVKNCQISNNNRYGIFCEDSTPAVKNCVVLNNGFLGDGFQGINIYLPTEVPILYNNTVIYNATEGIAWTDDTNSEGDPNHPDYPDIQNCILYYNNDGGAQVTGFDQDTCASYCDIEGCNEVNNNINDTPGFMLVFDPEDPCSTTNPYHYHLAFDSPCMDMGNPNHDANDVGLYDIDGEDRLANARVDIGADENNLCDSGNQDDIFNDLDWNLDGTVDSYELCVFAGAWLTRDPNDPDIITDPNFADDPDYADTETLEMWRQTWDPLYNLDEDYDVDYGDFAVFAQNWLWRTCWKQNPLDLMEMMAMGGGEGMFAMSGVSGVEEMMMPVEMDSVSVSLAEPEPEEAELSTAELASLAEGIYGIIKYIDTAIEEGYENAENLYELKDFLEGVLQDLQAGL
ncbi:MAG TPA: DUF11 domain-containing protein [Planctomycetes bacterium]|nr:DUF11 domain-containing protein [Planctomycetota bacterium]